MDSRLLNNAAKMVFLVLLLLFAHASTSPTEFPVTTGPSVTANTEKKEGYMYLPVDSKNASASPVEGSPPASPESVKAVPKYYTAVDSQDLPNTQTDLTYQIVNSTVPRNTSDTSGIGDGSTLNLAIIPVLAIFFIIIFVCIKCCNRVKRDVAKDKYYIEDGKPLFRIEPESHPDYLSSVSSGYNPYSTVTSGYNPYSTVTSGYNPYSTVTTMMSNMSTASEKKDAGTMVKPRDIWKTMRHKRGSSVPDLEELARERDLIENVAEEVKKLKLQGRLSPPAYSDIVSKSLSTSPRPPGSSRKTGKSQRPKLPRNALSKSADDVLDPKHGNHELVQAELHPGTPDEGGVLGECEALLAASSDTNGDASPSLSIPLKKLLPQLSNKGEKLADEESADTGHGSGSASSSEGSSPDGTRVRAFSGSGIRGQRRAKPRSVSFQDGWESPKRKLSKNKSSASPPLRSSPPKDIEIVRKPVTTDCNIQRKFSLSKVQDNGALPSKETASPLSSDTANPSAPNRDHQDSQKSMNSDPAQHDHHVKPLFKSANDGSPGIHRKSEHSLAAVNPEHLVPNCVSPGSSPTRLQPLSCH